jgi:hypothetical protein
VLDYLPNGQRKLVWRSTLADARKAAGTAIDKITEGQSLEPWAEGLAHQGANHVARSKVNKYVGDGVGFNVLVFILSRPIICRRLKCGIIPNDKVAWTGLSKIWIGGRRRRAGLKKCHTVASCWSSCC